VISGLPASGTSELGRRLGAALALDLLDKDDFLEAGFVKLGDVDGDTRQRLSRVADDPFATPRSMRPERSRSRSGVDQGCPRRRAHHRLAGGAPRGHRGLLQV